jgi:hypothetical protein
MVQCVLCNNRKAILKRPKTAETICKECFYQVFEDEIHQTIVSNKLFKPGEKVAIAASGGKGRIHITNLIEIRFYSTCRGNDPAQQKI